MPRVRLSVVVGRAHRLLFSFLVACFVAVGFAYLFWVNHMGLQGVMLGQLVQEKTNLMDEKGQIEAKIAGYSATRFIADNPAVEPMLGKNSRNVQYFVRKNIFTAQKKQNVLGEAAF